MIMTVQDYLDSWLMLRRTRQAPRTVERNTQLVAMCAALAPMDMRDVTAMSALALIDAHAAAGHARTAEQLYIMLHTAFSDAQRLGIIDRNPIDPMLRPKYEPSERRIWSPDEARRYYDAAVTHKHAIALLLPLLCGLRRGEVCGLDWRHVDMAGDVLHIRQQMIALDSGGTIITAPKSRAGVRDVPISRYIRPLLASRRQIGGLVAGITPACLTRAYARICAQAQLPRIGLHGMRHTMATAAIRGGADMRTLQQILGHANYTTTAAIYTHPDLTMCRSLIDATADNVL